MEILLVFLRFFCPSIKRFQKSLCITNILGGFMLKKRTMALFMAAAFVLSACGGGAKKAEEPEIGRASCRERV